MLRPTPMREPSGPRPGPENAMARAPTTVRPPPNIKPMETSRAMCVA